MGKIVKMEHIDKAYQMGKTTVPVLNQINLVVEKGEFLSIVGASGSGKSTLMNIIGCMDTADAGSYILEEIDVLSCKDSQLTQLRNEKIGFIFQKYHLIPQYTILQNVILPLLIRGKRRREAIEIAHEVIHMVGLEARVGHKPSELSGGQQQRVAIARALATKPTLLLADEPTGALDSHTGEDILKLFQELNDMGNTIIMITHDSKVAGYSKKTAYLSDGVFI